MKATKILAAAAALLLVFSCKEGNLENNGPSAGSNTPITLKADNVYPVMNQDTQTEDVLELSWNATTNMGSGARIEYILMIDRKGGNFESAYEIPLGVNTLKRSFTAGELNDILMDDLGYDADEAIELDVCILAIIRNNLIADVVSNSLTITLTTFVPKLTSLYLIGDATTSLWELGNAIAMMPIPGEDGGFSWSGELGMGEIKFVTSLEEWVPSYGQGVEEGTLYLRTKMWEDESESIETEDPKIKISDPGTYRITVNIETMTYSMVKTGGPKYYNMYLTGTSVGETLEMFRVGYAFVKGVELQKGDLYFSVEPDDSGDHYWAATENQAVSDNAVSMTSGYKWNVTVPGKLYHINLYIKEGKEMADIVASDPYETIYLVGNATSAEWTIADAIPMTRKSEYVQEWSGTLKAGELKFTCDRKSDWYGAWYLASTPSKVPTGEVEPIIFVDKARKQTASMGIKAVDQKWLIREPGTYKITLDQKAETVIIAKQ